MPTLRHVAGAIAAAALCHVLPAQTPKPQPVLETDLRSHPRERLTLAYPKANAAIGVGLKWLADHQDKDGRWNADEFMQHDEGRTDGPGNATYDVAVTGLALLAFAREGTADRKDANHVRMLRGASWLSKQQNEQKGRFGTDAPHDFIYGHAIATFALCAVAASTKDVATRQAAQRGIQYLEKHRNPYSVWRYQPSDGDKDTSVTTWATLAYLAAIEIDLDVEEEALTHITDWIEQVTDELGRTGYARKGEASSRNRGNHMTRFPPDKCETMTAAGLLCRLGCGQDASDEIITKSVGLLLAKPAKWAPKESLVDNCYWFFATTAVQHMPKAMREDWNTQVHRALIAGQRQDALFTGSWDPVGPWGENGGRIYSTAMSVLALQALYSRDAAVIDDRK